MVKMCYAIEPQCLNVTFFDEIAFWHSILTGKGRELKESAYSQNRTQRGTF